MGEAVYLFFLFSPPLPHLPHLPHLHRYLIFHRSCQSCHLAQAPQESIFPEFHITVYFPSLFGLSQLIYFFLNPLQKPLSDLRERESERVSWGPLFFFSKKELRFIIKRGIFLENIYIYIFFKRIAFSKFFFFCLTLPSLL